MLFTSFDTKSDFERPLLIYFILIVRSLLCWTRTEVGKGISGCETSLRQAIAMNNYILRFPITICKIISFNLRWPIKQFLKKKR
jgi:hypothetical protein